MVLIIYSRDVHKRRRTLRIWQIYPEVANDVRKAHEDANLHGHHGWPHAFEAAELARQLAYNEWHSYIVARHAGLAAILHNEDHILWHLWGEEKYNRTENIDKEVARIVRSRLVGLGLKDSVIEDIVYTVLNHTTNIPNAIPIS